MTTTPLHSYETVEGTEPVTHGKHEPRTTKHTVTTGADTDLFMMTEIGDGVFVQWSTCRRCNQQVAGCKCPEGPQEPHYMQPWREKRFARSLNERPDPSYDLLDSVVEWVKEKGYKVTKSNPKPSLDDRARASIEASGFKTQGDVLEAMAGDIMALQDPLVQRMMLLLPKEDEGKPATSIAEERLEEAITHFDAMVERHNAAVGIHPPHLPDRYEDREVEDVNLPDTTGQVDAGLDSALERVREAKRDVSDMPDDF